MLEKREAFKGDNLRKLGRSQRPDRQWNEGLAMMTVEQATKARIAAIDAECQRLPRGASEAERKLLELCANAESPLTSAWRAFFIGPLCSRLVPF